MDDKNKSAAKVSDFKKPELWQSFIMRFGKLSPKAKRLMATRYLVVVLIILVGGGLIWQHQKNNSRLAAMSAVVEGMSPNQASQYLASIGEYKFAQKIWQNLLTVTNDTPTKINIYNLQTSLAIKFKKYNDAQKYADQSYKVAPDYSVTYVTMAYLAQAQGDKASAKKDWQLAIKFIDPNNPGSNIIQYDYQSSLDALK